MQNFFMNSGDGVAIGSDEAERELRSGRLIIGLRGYADKK